MEGNGEGSGREAGSRLGGAIERQGTESMMNVTGAVKPKGT